LEGVFTGIVQGAYPVSSVEDRVGQRRLVVRLDDALVAGLQVGASVAVAGVCLTVVATSGAEVRFDVVPETLAHTTLGDLTVGELVNVERSLRIGDELGGHIVGGHVDGVGEIVAAVSKDGDELRDIAVSPESMAYVVRKGFIAVDGCSLTVGSKQSDQFRVHLIPETCRRTTFGHRRVGDKVNIEFDRTTVAVVDTVERVLGAREPRPES
jgi:riboflavin synthase